MCGLLSILPPQCLLFERIPPGDAVFGKKKATCRRYLERDYSFVDALRSQQPSPRASHPNIFHAALSVSASSHGTVKTNASVFCHVHFLPKKIMSDDLTNRGAQDRSRISLTEPHEVRYWTEALGVDF